ncbi:SGNH hydrolase-type esterase domain-containing protein [Lophiotrema nucula]|uniref:SGNH hydrolase-type esterase domain-containing protein n=1 Tax=Lophiotrema nucula TaxID=690887 RepID=A0A6A5ZEA1_9PLEO|nr:SGNH hydrolase-type esterase domain-containing protein [Lophiotrema nucula]
MIIISNPTLALPVALLTFLLPLFSTLPIVSSLPLRPRDVIASGTKLRILPLGDSITYGYQPSFEDGTNGYRYQLSQRLSGSDFLFVGTKRSGDMADNYNEGHSGYTISQIHNVMGPALDERPNIILLHAGTNDVNTEASEPYSEMPDRLGSLIDSIFETCPDSVVLVAKIINSGDTDTEERVKSFNNAVPGVVKQRADAGKKVMVVDQSVVGADELADGTHPTDEGYAHMADVWFEGIKAAAEQSLISAPVGDDPS